MTRFDPEFYAACLMSYCEICAEAELARAEIQHEAEMERRVERAFEERRW